MRITLGLVVALLLVLAAVALLSAHFQASQQKAEQQEELERRSRILAETLGEAVAPLLERGPSQRLDDLVERFGNRQRLAGVAVYDLQGPAPQQPGIAPLRPAAAGVGRHARRAGPAARRKLHRKPARADMLSADLVGFQTQFHCNNFLDTVERALECRVDWQRFAVHRDGQTTLVKPFPISVAFPNAFPDAAPTEAADKDRASLLRDLGIKATYLGVGVERMDYTKGVLERLRAIERFLEKYPRYQGQFAYVQLTAPSRTHIKRYHDFLAEVEAEAERINWKFKAKEWRRIVFLKKHHSHQEILPFYKHADLCLVTSLHDGMNLVAKEFVACRDDEGGVLILSQFAGSANELVDAFVVRI